MMGVNEDYRQLQLREKLPIFRNKSYQVDQKYTYMEACKPESQSPLLLPPSHSDEHRTWISMDYNLYIIRTWQPGTFYLLFILPGLQLVLYTYYLVAFSFHLFLFTFLSFLSALA